MSALPHIFKPTLAQVEQTNAQGHTAGPLLLFCAAVNIELDMEADERLAAMPGFNPKVEVRKDEVTGGVKQEVCTFRVPLQSSQVKREEEADKQQLQQQQSSSAVKTEPRA